MKTKLDFLDTLFSARKMNVLGEFKKEEKQLLVSNLQVILNTIIEAYFEPCKISMMELFVKIVNG